MIGEARSHIARVLAGLGVSRVFRHEDDLDKPHQLPYAVVLLDSSGLTKEPATAAVTDDLTVYQRTYRRRLYRRRLRMTVALVHETEEQAEQLMEQFLARLGSSFLDAFGNAISVDVPTERWTEQTSTLRGKVVVEHQVEFVGGVYQDIQVPLVEIGDFELEVG